MCLFGKEKPVLGISATVGTGVGELVDRVLRFPILHLRKVKQAEVATMVKDEVEPLGGFIGDAFITPVFLGGQALTAMVFILVQSMWLGVMAGSIVLFQAFLLGRIFADIQPIGVQGGH